MAPGIACAPLRRPQSQLNLMTVPAVQSPAGVFDLELEPAAAPPRGKAAGSNNGATAPDGSAAIAAAAADLCGLIIAVRGASPFAHQVRPRTHGAALAAPRAASHWPQQRIPIPCIRTPTSRHWPGAAQAPDSSPN
jgi:hypothetical protein